MTLGVNSQLVFHAGCCKIQVKSSRDAKPSIKGRIGREHGADAEKGSIKQRPQPDVMQYDLGMQVEGKIGGKTKSNSAFKAQSIERATVVEKHTVTVGDHDLMLGLIARRFGLKGDKTIGKGGGFSHRWTKPGQEHHPTYHTPQNPRMPCLMYSIGHGNEPLLRKKPAGSGNEDKKVVVGFHRDEPGMLQCCTTNKRRLFP